MNAFDSAIGPLTRPPGAGPLGVVAGAMLLCVGLASWPLATARANVLGPYDTSVADRSDRPDPSRVDPSRVDPSHVDPVPPPAQAARYDAAVAKTILELQPFRRTRAIAVRDDDGRLGRVDLIEINRHVGAWSVLRVDWGQGASTDYHLDNPEPGRQRLRLSAFEPAGLVIEGADGAFVCDLWSGHPSALGQARASGLPFAPLCGGRLHLRNPVAGRKSDLERVTEFLRDHVWGGETIIGLVREEFFRDAFFQTAAAEVIQPGAGPEADVAPRPAALDPAYADRAVTANQLGIAADGSIDGRLALGRWHPASGQPGVHLSVVQPGAIDRAILDDGAPSVRRLDAVEDAALAYMIAFDLDQLDIGFALGTEHPRVGWSARRASILRDPNLPGPDGVGTKAPLVATGMVSPALAARTVATFTGGFKRAHGAFRYGMLAERNHGSHYGFIENGAVFSKLQPDLATLTVDADGDVDLITWSPEDDQRLGRIRHARQNGVPLIEPDPESGEPVPGALVGTWGSGNWSGSADGEQRTVRAGLCLLEPSGRRFLVYGYFSAATPSAMTRVFQAYGCGYAMHLDMNALEHTYLALYLRQSDEMAVQHLVRGMEVLDQTVDGTLAPRFLGFPDNRDFFYVIRREPTG